MNARPVLPVLTDEVVGAPSTQEWLLRNLPPLLAQSMAELQPQFEQQLLEHLLPKLLDALAQEQLPPTPPAPGGGARLP